MLKALRKRTRLAYYIPMAITYIILLSAVNLFIFGEFSKYFSIEKNTAYYSIMIALTVIFPIFILIEKTERRFLTRVLYSIAMTGGGINFIVFSFVLFSWIINALFTIPLIISQLILIILPSSVALYAIINATKLKEKKITIHIKGLKKKKKFVHLSDIHLGTIRNADFLARIVRRTNNLNPDAVFITGDLIDNNAKINKDILQELDNFRAPVYFSNGNHEEYEGYSEVNHTLSKTKLIILRNRYEKLGEFQIIGVDYNFNHKVHLKNVLESLNYNRNKPTILLHHVPTGTEIAEANGVDLMLSGHTHDGQIFPLNFVVKLVFKHIYGTYKTGHMTLYTSSGTGTWGPVLRLGSHNEIVLIEAVPKD